MNETQAHPPFRDWDDIGVDSFAELGRAYYKGTACGCWMVAVMPDGREIHYSDEKAQNITDATPVAAIKVGSIVEGVDYGTETQTARTPAELGAAVDAVEYEAECIWNDTHGCATCAAHWVEICGMAEPEECGVPVWDECPECYGDGICIF